VNKRDVKDRKGTAKGDGVDFRRFLFYFWFFAEITDIKALAPIPHYL